MLKVEEIRDLIKLIDESSIDEFDYESNGTKVSMKKQAGEVIQERTIVSEPAVRQETTAPAPSAAPVQPQEQVKEEPVPNQPQEQNAGDFDHEIVSPMVGTFYSSPEPESDAYVKKGDKVNKDTVVCIVEAMKLFNEIEADVSGEIVEILAEDGELVEYGQPLFRVKA
ncbi:acetyl-CoA carboxylase biotin carboxyl carrier protein [Sediminibacillus halophilus]|uniref:Biotin carboxyl carrier protein of acetyl-CoA carboxylase n=1 Tax=Sediminibacillus halophilus TaxID=482461 RepID=A0A1G9LL42_9BACI|nr:acetyl-CoA carboxylase biotin carboxyl carrier protein [Sediminibacillus halophilus]SDL62670.1 acetyl-CoA carboxylase biotin carboxyl carrier protein [Sediminibacillus halophilus]